MSCEFSIQETKTGGFLGFSGQLHLPGEIKINDRSFLKKGKTVFLLNNYSQGYPLICKCMCICMSMNTHKCVHIPTILWILKFREMQRRLLELRVFPFHFCWRLEALYIWWIQRAEGHVCEFPQVSVITHPFSKQIVSHGPKQGFLTEMYNIKRDYMRAEWLSTCMAINPICKGVKLNYS